jgi:hypothetical protein
MEYLKYGMTIVNDYADARRHTSTMMKSPMRFSLTGEHVDCTDNTSQPLTLFQISELHINLYISKALDEDLAKVYA